MLISYLNEEIYSIKHFLHQTKEKFDFKDEHDLPMDRKSSVLIVFSGACRVLVADPENQ